MRRSARTTIRRDAERLADKWEKQLRAFDWQGHGVMSWEIFQTRFEDEHLNGLAAGSAKKYMGVFSVFTNWLAPEFIIDVTADELSKYQTYLRQHGRSEATIKSHFAHLKAALNWAREMGFIDEVPRFPKIKRAKGSKVMKGRPITLEEFERMVQATCKIIKKPNLGKSKKDPGPDMARVPSWQHLLRGLWYSGLRLGEAIELHWTDETKIRVDMSPRYPMLQIPCESEKGNQDRILVLTPDAARFFAQTPPDQRYGYVFNPQPQNNGAGRLSLQTVSRTIQQIGEKAGVKVDTNRRTGEPVFASSHDLRRSFGSRWAAKVMPQRLMELMRHESIETTLRYYVGQNAQKTAAELWEMERNWIQSGSPPSESESESVSSGLLR